VIFLFFTGCGKQENKIYNYGFPREKNENLNITIKLSEFKNFGMLVDKIREITCSDSIPKIVIENKYSTRNIYPVEYCEPIPFNPKGKHYVTFENGRAYKDYFSKEIETDSLGQNLKNEYAYYRTSKKSDRPESYIVIIECKRNESLNGIEEFLNNLTREFDKLKTNLELNIAFWEVVTLPPPPPAEKLKEN